MDTIHAWRLIQLFIQKQGLSWIQGPGGNVSIKQSQNLFIKPSGRRIDQISELSELAQVSMSHFKQSWPALKQTRGEQKEKMYSQLLADSSSNENLRPSMETGFHVLLNAKYVIHCHSLKSILLSEFFWNDQKKLQTLISSQLGLELNRVQVIDPVMPGVQLTEAIEPYANATVFYLKSHGLVLATNEIDFLQKFLNAENEIFEKFCQKKDLQWPTDDLTGEFRPLFPDAMILKSRISQFFFGDPGLFSTSKITLSKNIKVEDADAFENWLAIQALLLTNPQIRNIPEQISDHVNFLPTEIARKKIMAKPS
jgi:hypothetical protein